ncbi:MAG: aldo/keto reductase [Methanosphaera sp.]|nr:aldo/keto reductase [Methanosphaera sp.]
MEYRKMPNNGAEVSMLGFGLMRLEDKNDMIDVEFAKDLVEYAVEHGINYFDTAYGYGDGSGSSEKALGEIIDKIGCRDSVYLSTKLYRESVASRDDMEKMFSEELNNFKTDHIDYYYIHNVISYQNILDLKDMGLFEFLDEKRMKGQIINVGFSFHGPYEDFEKVIDEYDWDMTLLQYNYLDVNAQAGIRAIELASSRDMGVFIMEPLKGGILADFMPKQAHDIITQSGIQRDNVDLALSWIFNTPGITCVLSGMKELDMVKQNIQIVENYGNNPLTDAELEVIEEVKGVFDEIIKIPCTSCDYCAPCPQGVEISAIFQLYNDKYIFPDKRCLGVHPSYIIYAAIVLGIMDSPFDGSLCIDCGLCKRKCPQQLDIPELLKQIDDSFDGKQIKELSPILTEIFKSKEMTNILESLEPIF